MARPRLAAEKRQAILDAVNAAAGKRSRADIAREFGVSGSTVGRVCDEAGLTDVFDRTTTVNATRARQVDLAAGRAALQARWLAKANEALDRSEREYTVHAFGGQDNRYAEHLMDLPPAGDYRSFVTAAAVATDKMVVLAKLDASDDGLSAAVSTIDKIMDVVRGVHPDEATDPDS